MRNRIWTILRNLLVEIGLYSLSAALYFGVFLRLLDRPLALLFHEHPTGYAIVGLLLIVGQAVLLGAVISFLTDRLGLGRLE